MTDFMPAVLYSDEHLEVIHREGTSDYLLVSFNEMGLAAGEGRYWASTLCDKLDINCIAFVTHRPNWFPAVSLRAAIETALGVVTKFDTRVGYGFSQGGYAAIKASKGLGLTDTLAFSPQWSIDPDVHIDPRFNQYFSAELNTGMEISSDDQPARLRIFFDPGDRGDAEHVNRISKQVNADLITVHSSGHGSVRSFANSVAFSALIAALDSIDAVRRAVRSARVGSDVRHTVIAQRAAARYPRWAIDILGCGLN